MTNISYPNASEGAGYSYDVERDKLGRIQYIHDSGQENYLVSYSYKMSLVTSRGYNLPGVENKSVSYQITYDDLGRAGRHYTYLYNDIGADTDIVDFNYTFDDNGNITAIEFAHLGASPDNDYTYDTLDRVVDVDYHDDSAESFTYDKLGNRIEAQLRGKEGPPLTYARNAVTNRYDDDGGSYDIEGVYDAAGNFEYMSI